MKAHFFIDSSSYEYDFFSPTLVSDLVKSAVGDFSFPCGEKGICGNCKVNISGNVSPLSESEKAILTDYDINSGIRLACCTFALGDVFIGYAPSLFRFEKVTEDFNENIKTLDKNRDYFLAADLGTTNIEIEILDNSKNSVLNFHFVNPQIKYGDNVISRMEYAKNNSVLPLKDELNKFIKPVFDSLNIRRAVVTGNTAMLHFFTGLDTEFMLSFPFTPKSLFGYEKDGIYYPDCISAFLGADILCSALYSDIISYDNSLLIDIGTNGEMMFYDGKEIVCTSVSAGPAFEGSGIRCGSIGQDGAINKAFFCDEKICYSVIGNSLPSSICSSGLIDTVAVLLEKGIINREGFLEKPYRFENSSVYIYPEDIRAFQLAKSAVRSGIDTICSGKTPKDIFICGNFGSSLNIENCVKTGMLPENKNAEYHILGNGALGGAKMFLDDRNLTKAEKIKNICRPINLAENRYFSNAFIENINF